MRPFAVSVGGAAMNNFLAENPPSTWTLARLDNNNSDTSGLAIYHNASGPIWGTVHSIARILFTFANGTAVLDHFTITTEDLTNWATWNWRETY